MPKQKVNKQNKKITDFFLKSKTIENVGISETRTNVRQKFYQECAKTNCQRPECVSKKAELTEKFENLKEKRSDIAKAIQMVSNMIEKKENKIKILKSKLEESGCLCLPTDINKVFKRFEDSFPESGLAQLRSVDGNWKYDSTFILIALRLLYKNDLTRLKIISITGRSRNKTEKIAMSPQKVQTLNDIFKERLDALNLGEDETTKRSKRLNYHINSAIHNVINSNGSELQQLNQEINCTQQTN